MILAYRPTLTVHSFPTKRLLHF